MNTLVSIGSVDGQSYWISNYAVGVSALANSVRASSDGSALLAGSVIDGTQRASLAKYSSTGSIIFQRALDNPTVDAEAFYDVREDASGNIFCVGVSVSVGDTRILTAKYNSSAAIQWQRTLNLSGVTDYGWRVGVDTSGDAYIAGYTQTSGTNLNILNAKYTSAGTLSWQRQLGGSLNDYPFGMAVDGNGNSFTVGYAETVSSSDDQPIIAKRDLNGAISWQKIYSLPSPRSSFRGAALDASGNIFVAGTSTNPSAFNFAYIAKLDSTGSPVWQRSLGTNGAGEDDTFFQVQLGADGYLYACGRTYSNSLAKYIALIAKYDQSGNLVFQRTIDVTGLSILEVNVSSSYPAMYASVTAYNSGSGIYYSVIMRLPSDGSKTGSYTGVITGSTVNYATSSLVDQSRSYSASTSTITDAAGAFTGATSTFTDSTPTYTRSLVSVT